MPVLSIQSHVAYGRVGNRMAVFALERLGHEVWPVNTVALSNHPAYGSFTGRTAPGPEVADLVAGIGARGGFAGCDAVLSGYLGDPATGPAMLEAVAAVKVRDATVPYCLDPVMGDVEGGLFVDEAIPCFFRERALPASDIVVPNQFELGLLSGRTVSGLGEAREAARALLAEGPRIVVATGLPDGDGLATLAAAREGSWVVRTPRVEAPAYGAGDLLSALFLAHSLDGAEPAEALSRTVSSVFGVFQVTADAGADALLLVAAQDELVAPSRRFPAEPC